ncbi:MAG TPA: hypothetical protein VGE07_11295 [Herpetosiphonaceae bacterium]
MARFKDMANIWSTIKELDVQEIRDQAELPVRIALLGRPDGPRDMLARLLARGAGRYAAQGVNPLDLFEVPLARERQGDLGKADLLVLALAGNQQLSHDEYLAYEKITVLNQPVLLVVIGAGQLPEAGADAARPDWFGVPAAFLDNLGDESQTRAKLAAAVIEGLPEELRLAAARRLPGLRGALAADLINGVALTNATYAFTSGLPEMIPFLNLPLNAADMLVLTKNQAVLAYRLALAMGAAPDFSAMIKELIPVVGSGFLWRQLARQLIGLIPGVGLLPKVAVAYAGTYATGTIAWRWYERGETLSPAAVKDLLAEALGRGKAWAQAQLKRRKGKAKPPAEPKQPALLDAKPEPLPLDDADEPGVIGRAVGRIRGLLPGGDKHDS